MQHTIKLMFRLAEIESIIYKKGLYGLILSSFKTYSNETTFLKAMNPIWQL